MSITYDGPQYARLINIRRQLGGKILKDLSTEMGEIDVLPTPLYSYGEWFTINDIKYVGYMNPDALSYRVVRLSDRATVLQWTIEEVDKAATVVEMKKKVKKSK